MILSRGFQVSVRAMISKLNLIVFRSCVLERQAQLKSELNEIFSMSSLGMLAKGNLLARQEAHSQFFQMSLL